MGELDPGLQALERAVPRLTSLLRTVPDPRPRAIGTWSVGDVASHVASVFENYAAMISGREPVLATSTEDIGRINSMWLDRDPRRDPREASSRIEDAYDRMMQGVHAAKGNPSIAWHGGLTFPLSTVVCLALGEVLVHGHDIASASGSSWVIPADEARTVLAGIIVLSPQYVDRAAAGGFSAVYDLRIRRGLRTCLEFIDGRLTLGEPGMRADCTISADAAAFLLVAYGRVSVWRLVLRGRLLAWGRRPWLGLKLPSLLRNP